jgi:hypothetical protein
MGFWQDLKKVFSVSYNLGRAKPTRPLPTDSGYDPGKRYAIGINKRKIRSAKKVDQRCFCNNCKQTFYIKTHYALNSIQKYDFCSDCSDKDLLLELNEWIDQI